VDYPDADFVSRGSVPVGMSSYFDKAAAEPRSFAAGDAVPYSGIYRVKHQQRHAAEHDVTCVSGRNFPSCRECGADVQFKLLQAVRLIDKHELFRTQGTPMRSGTSQPWWDGSVLNGETEVF
jgi:hypothetical protein